MMDEGSDVLSEAGAEVYNSWWTVNFWHIERRGDKFLLTEFR